MLITNSGDYVPVGYWSTIEVYISVVCACLPAIPSLFRRKAKNAIVQTLPGSEERNRTAKNRDIDEFPLLKVASTYVRGTTS